ncbi:GNAT family N-acetyltransferase [Vibrio sp. SM6]|uniref:GNAT family N-acetyltransferase n=1 Tax=Vibrio agarilyticus TaxID=2726741 RepID=A0A7X8TQR1_9VIBR|nr:GNAT family N-acetyltransferase [Vibrio agarilyticus]NLS13024.1 GNAT family N-acetyltransferase [Vibrio agarilyticus]
MLLNTSRLEARFMTDDDWSFFYQLFCNHDVIKHCFDPLPKAEIKAKFEQRRLPWKLESNCWLCLMVETRDTKTKVGIIGFYWNGQVAELGFMFDPLSHNQGFATESNQALLTYAQAHWNIKQFRAVVTEGNSASESVLKKCGFHLATIEPDAYQIGGHWFSDHIYELRVTEASA